MNANTKTARGPYLTNRHQSIDSGDELPHDREVRRLRYLSRDVGAACNVWLNSRGIKTRSWGDFNVWKSRFKRARFELQLENDS
jgi:hypothetical protein